MKFSAPQIVTLGEVMDRLGAIVKDGKLNEPMMVGLAKAYALSALAYAYATLDRGQI